MVVVADGVGWSLDLDTSVDRLELRIRKFTPIRREHDAMENAGNSFSSKRGETAK
jgi:hypothetical protein